MQYLKQHQEQIPAWLQKHTKGNPFSTQDFFGSRVVFYPGSGTDGQAIAAFGGASAAHCFVYADYGVTQVTIEKELGNRYHGIKGYRVIDSQNLQPQELGPLHWTRHLAQEDMDDAQRYGHFLVQPYAFWVVLERESSWSEQHGAHRLAVLFIGGDGIASYDALFCQDQSKPPFAILLQDHGFGGNYTRFGRDGLLHQLAQQTGKAPEYLLVGTHSTKAWDGYTPIEGAYADRGGMHLAQRQLFKALRIAD